MVVHGMVGGTIAAFITACFAGKFQMQITANFIHSHTLTHLKHMLIVGSVFFTRDFKIHVILFVVQTECDLGNSLTEFSLER